MITIKKSNLPIGLDISDEVLKAVELKKNGEKIKIGATSKYKLKSGIIEEGEIKDRETLKKSLSILLQKTNHGSFNSDEVVVCLPDPKTFIKLIEVEKTPNDLKNIISAQIEKHIPLQLNNIYYDWQIIEEERDYYKILIGAAPKSIVNAYAEILNDIKLSVVAFEIEAISIARAILKEENKKYNGNFDKNYCFIDIGAKRTSLTIYTKNTIATSLSLPLSGNETTDIIAESLEINHQEAEKAKIICGLDKAQAHGIVSDILSNTIDSVIEKINSSLDFFTKHYPKEGNIDEIILCGGGSYIKNLDKSIEEKLKIKTKLANPLINLNETTENTEKIFIQQQKIDSKDKKESTHFKLDTTLSYTTALGLALRNVFIDKI